MLKIAIDTGNAAFEDFEDDSKGYEIARILGRAVSALEDGIMSCTLSDINGNKVGLMREDGEVDTSGFYIEIETDNAAFEDEMKPFECARIIRHNLTDIEMGQFDIRLHDINGNKVGFAGENVQIDSKKKAGKSPSH